jgi:type I restriction enzyme M protein
VDSLPSPDLIAAEIVENLQAALEQFQSVALELAPAAVEVDQADS